MRSPAILADDEAKSSQSSSTINNSTSAADLPQAAVETLGVEASGLYAQFASCESAKQLDANPRLIWERYGAGKLSDREASHPAACIEGRRPHRRFSAAKPVGAGGQRRLSRFLPRRPQRSPDRKASRERRRMLGGSSALPENLRHHFTEGQRSVLCILAGEIKRHGFCDLPIDKLAALAGVCRTTVQTAFHEARRLGLIRISERPRPGRKNLPNIVEIVSREWRTGSSAPASASRIGSKPVKTGGPTKSTDQERKLLGDELSVRQGHPAPRMATSPH